MVTIQLTFDSFQLLVVCYEVVLNHHLSDHFAPTGAQCYNQRNFKQQLWNNKCIIKQILNFYVETIHCNI